MAKKKTAPPAKKLSVKETKKNAGLPPVLDTPEFRTAWAEWERFAAAQGIACGPEDAQRQWKLLSKLSPEEAIAELRKNMGEKTSQDDNAKDDHRQAKPANADASGKPKGKKQKAEKTQLSALDAAAKVLAESGTHMNCQQMIDAMAAAGYWQSPAGKTPASTLYSAVLRELKVKDKEARFEKIARGQFQLRTQ